MDKHRSRSRDPTVPQHDLEPLTKIPSKVNYRRNQVMKKLLTIMTLALALCLICGVALATSEYKVDYEFKDATDLAVGRKVTVNNITYTIIEIDSYTKKADHNDGLNRVWATGKNGTELVRLECTLLSTHETETKVTKAATCTEAGVKAIKCKDCSYSVEERIAPIPHSTIDKTVPKTCKDYEQTGKWCTMCEQWIGTVTTNYAGGLSTTHKYHSDEETIPWKKANYTITAPDCSKSSTSWKVEEKCYVCGKDATKRTVTQGTTVATYKNYMLNTFHIEIDMDDQAHVWDAAKKIEKNCYHGAGEIKWCKVCSKYVIDAPSTYDKVAAPVWVVEKGLNCKLDTANVKVYCANCKGDKAAHGYATITLTPDHSANTKKKDLTGTDKETAFPVTISGTYKYNDAGSYAITPLVVTVSHDFAVIDGADISWDTDANAVANAKTPICARAIANNYKCSICSSTVRWQKITTDAPGHNWSQWTLYDDGEGKTVTKRYERTCSKCNSREIKAIEGEPKPVHNTEAEHTWEVDKDYKWKCGEVQNVTYKCACGATKTVYDVDVKHAPGAYTETVIKAATCKEAGLQHNVCTNCKLDEYVVIPVSTEHTWDEGKITKAATKEADGEKTFTCTVCGETKKEAVKYVVTADPKYTLTADYAGGVVAGKLAHVEDTLEASAKYVRVTFYIGTYYMATTAEVEADGTYAVEGVGPIDYITVVPTGNSAVNPDEVQRIGEAEEIFVK